MKTYLGISRDHSASMRSISRFAARDYNQLIADVHASSVAENIETVVSVVKYGVGYSGFIKSELINCNIKNVPAIAESHYVTDGSSTPLFDSIWELIEQLESVPDAGNPDVNFLVMAVTDGEDNSSKEWKRKLVDKIRQLQATDHWTFVFRVPKGYGKELNRMGIPIGNILEWEQTEQGVQKSTVATTEAVGSFFRNTSSGTRSTSTFYNTDLSGVSSVKIKAALVDISSEVSIWDVLPISDGRGIREFCEMYLTGPMKIGSAFYQLMKSEKAVQDYKQICILDKKSGSVYSGAAVRDLLGLPYSGAVKIVPGNHGAYEIFVQSTSVNRKLVKNTKVLYWDAVGRQISSQSTPSTKQISAPVSVPVPPAPVNKPIHSVQYIGGYIKGFEAGKLQLSHNISNPVYEYDKGYFAGYKDGRGKKKRLYK